MTSIFTSSYSELAKRIRDHSTDANRASDGPQNSSHKKFGKVLADIEANRGKSSESGAITAKLPGTIGAPQPLISNITPAESDAVKHAAINPTANPTPAKLMAADAVPAQNLSVNTSDLAVKSPPSGEMRMGRAPAAPVITGVNRVTITPNSRAALPRYANREIENIISTAGRFHGVDPRLSLAVARAESDLRPDAVSKDGFDSKGIFQLLDSTAKDLIGRFDVREKYDPFDPAMNSYLGVGYLRRLHDIFSSETELAPNVRTIPVKSSRQLEKLAVAAFNAGEGNVALAQHRAQELGKDPTKFESIEPYLPATTRAYVTRVTELRNALAQIDGDDDVV